MSGWRRKIHLAARAAICVLLMQSPAHAQTVNQVATTSIVDTIYRADGSAAGGSVLISWPEFTTSANQAVPAGKTEIQIGSNGGVNFSLAPNAGAMPQGTYYTATFHLSDGTVSTEYWTVPQASQTSIAAIRSMLVPATVAVQSASVSYVNGAISDALTGYLPLTGGTLTGPLYLSEDPVQTTEAATKHYVDQSVGSVGSGIASKVDMNPAGPQTVNQPAGTTLSVNSLQSVQYASASQTGAGNNGVSNIMSGSNCQSGGCFAVAEPSYATTEKTRGEPNSCGGEPAMGDNDYCAFSWPSNSRLWDQRSGTDVLGYQNPVDHFGGLGVRNPLNAPAGSSSDAATATMYIYDFDQDYGNGQIIPDEHLMHQFAGGHNGNYGSGWGKTNTSLSQDKVVAFSQGQHSIRPQQEWCLGLGDCMGSPVEIHYAVGLSSPSDEGIHRGDMFINEDTRVYQGSCTSGCSAGSTLLSTNPTAGQGDQGEGRMAIDITQASGGNLGTVNAGVGTGQVLGQINGANNTPAQFVAPAGTFNVSTAAGTTAAAIVAGTGQGEPGVQTVAVTASSGAFTTGIACVSDQNAFEMVNVTAATATSITASFRRPHLQGAFLAQGGTCGWGISLNADTQPASFTNGNTVRVLIPLLGSPDSSHTYIETIINQGYLPRGSAWSYDSLSGADASYSTATGLVTVTGNFAFQYNGGNGVNFGNVYGQSLAVSGASDPNYNGTFPVTVTGASMFTYAPAAAPTSATAAVTVVECNCTFTMYPRAEVLSVYNSQTKQVDGTLGLEPNAVNWNSGDTVEVPHWHSPDVDDTHDAIVMYTPQAQSYGRGYSWAGIVSGDLRGFDLRNNAPLNEYQGYGGWHAPPTTAQYIQGWWNDTFLVSTAPKTALLSVGCKPNTPGNSDGCTKWDAAYSIGQFLSSSGGAQFNFDPHAGNFSFINAGSACMATMGSAAGTTAGNNLGGLALSGTSSACALFAPGIVLNGATELTGQTGTGANVVTNNSPSITAATLNGTTVVPSGQTLTINGTLNVAGTCTGCGASMGPAASFNSFAGTGTATMVANAAAGSGAAVACQNVCDAVTGHFQLTVGSNPTTGVLATLSFPTPYRANVPTCLVQYGIYGAGQITGIQEQETASSIVFTADTVLTANGQYQLRYICGGN